MNRYVRSKKTIDTIAIYIKHNINRITNDKYKDLSLKEFHILLNKKPKILKVFDEFRPGIKRKYKINNKIIKVLI